VTTSATPWWDALRIRSEIRDAADEAEKWIATCGWVVTETEVFCAACAEELGARPIIVVQIPGQLDMFKETHDG
jgi:hypothetical protein